MRSISWSYENELRPAVAMVWPGIMPRLDKKGSKMPSTQIGNAGPGERRLLITDDDLKRLKALIEQARYREPRGNAYLDSLEGELVAACVVAPPAIPPDVVTMNSTVHLLDLDTEERIVFTLVFPEEADMGSGRVSVLAPLGTAALGYRAGDILSWQVPDGVRRLQVVEVLFQPEASELANNSHRFRLDGP